MSHLTVDEIIGFVSSEEMNEEDISLYKKVNGHIRNCGECYEKVRSFELVYDEFKKLCLNDNFRNYAQNKTQQKGL